MRIDIVLEEQFQRNEISRLLEEVTQTTEVYDEYLDEALVLPSWMDSAIEFIADIPAAVTGINIILVVAGLRFLSDVAKLLIKIARRNSWVKRSPEFKEAFDFVTELSKDRKAHRGFDNERDYKRYMKGISKANRLVNKFLRQIVDDHNIPLRDKQKALRDVQLLQQKLQAEVRSASRQQSKRK